MTCRSYHLRISVHRYISLFFIIMLLLARLSFVVNSLLDAVFPFTLPSFYSVSHSLEHYIASLPKTVAARCNLTVDHRTSQNMILERGVSRQTRDLSLPLAYSLFATRYQCYANRRSSDFASANRAILYHGLSVSNCEAWTLGTTTFFKLLDVLIASLQPRETLQSSDLAALQQFAFARFSMSFQSL